MRTQIRKWGNSAALRLSTAALEQARFAIDQDVAIQATPGRIVIEATVPVFDLDEMIAAITPENTPAFQPHVQAVGAEVIEW